MTTPPQEIIASKRARSLALRLLSGEGSATMHAYRLDMCMGSMAHGTHEGQLMVAGQPEAAWLTQGATDIRLDLTLQAQHPDFAIMAASAHVLGTLTWFDAEQTEDLATRGLPSSLDAPLASPIGRLGVVQAAHLVLHDFTGATAVNLTTLTRVDVDTWAAHDSAAALNQTQLRNICWAAMRGAIPAEVTKRPAPPMCAHAIDRAFIIDVDPHGLTLMLTGSDEVVTAFAAFASPAATATEFSRSIDQLVASSAPTRQLRI